MEEVLVQDDDKPRIGLCQFETKSRCRVECGKKTTKDANNNQYSVNSSKGTIVFFEDDDVFAFQMSLDHASKYFVANATNKIGHCIGVTT